MVRQAHHERNGILAMQEQLLVTINIMFSSLYC